MRGLLLLVLVGAGSPEALPESLDLAEVQVDNDAQDCLATTRTSLRARFGQRLT